MNFERPLLRYAGSKFVAYKRFISKYMPPHTVYLEPFGGGGAILLNKPTSLVEIYNDIDYKLVNLFRVLQDPTKASLLMHRLHYTLYSEDELRRATDYINEVDEDNADEVLLAWSVIVKSWFGFSTDSVHEKRTQFKRHWATEGANERPYNYAQLFRHIVTMMPRFVERLEAVEVRHEDALDLISQFAPFSNVLIYIDPPYLPDVLTEIYYTHQNAYTHEYHRKMAAVINSGQAMAMVSGYAHDLYKEIFEDKGWQRIDYGAYTQNSATRVESLWINPPAWRAYEANQKQQMSLFDL